jgi:hypothetical protein
MLDPVANFTHVVIKHISMGGGKTYIVVSCSHFIFEFMVSLYANAR